MANKNMTIRFSPDGFSFAESPLATSPLPDEAPFHEVTPGPEFQQRLQEQLLAALPESEELYDLCCQFASSRVVLLSPDITDNDVAAEMYYTTVGKDDNEQIICQPLELPNGQQVTLCFGIDSSLYHFLQRNFGDLTFQHHLSSLLVEGARKAAGNCLVARCDNQTLEVAYYQQGRLGLVNVYRTHQADSRSYYVMNTWQQLGLDQLTDNLLVLGAGNEALQVRASLHRFIKHVFS